MQYDPNNLPQNDKEWAEFYKHTSDENAKIIAHERAIHDGYRQGVQMVVSLIISHMKRG